MPKTLNDLPRRKKLKIFAGMFLALTVVAIPMMYLEHTAGLRFTADGIVLSAEWDTPNHQMSKFVIQGKAPKPSVLHHHRVTLTPDDIKVGDRFRKVSGSRFCEINERKVLCIR